MRLLPLLPSVKGLLTQGFWEGSDDRKVEVVYNWFRLPNGVVYQWFCIGSTATNPIRVTEFPEWLLRSRGIL